MISLKQLGYAIAVGKTRHFKKAADACAVSQSALSTAITELEKQLEIQIFERDNKKVLVTPMGEKFLSEAERIKLSVDDLYALAQSNKAPLSYPLAIGVIPTIAPYLLPKVLPGLRQQYPDFKLKIVEEQSHILVDQVRKGDIDAAILALPFEHEGLLAFEFWQEDFYWVAHRENPRAEQTEITSEELKAERLLLLKDGHCLKDHALAACQIQDAETDHSLDSNSLHTLIQMVAGRLGTTLVPAMALPHLVESSHELRAVHLQDNSPHRCIAFLVRPNYVGLGNIELLIDLFRLQLEAAVIDHKLI